MKTIWETCCCCYHAKFQIYQDTFIDFFKTIWEGQQAPPIVQDFVSTIPCKNNLDDVFVNKICSSGKNCHECGGLALFHLNFPID